ncbi:hypothetical protein G7054_g2751 [Neopestalotiopsis clavispora]|nr:hypothetical protein G7054_g2751 [Neopestalotiopsis clavispora]
MGLTRSRTLTNSAAEFLELRSDEAIGAELAEISPEFVPELDRFLPRDDIQQQDYFVESQKRVETFKQTLALFQKNLIDRKVDKRYEIEIKDASSYTLDDVLKIAKVVQKKHSDADQVHSCMGRLKKFFHATGRNATTFKRLLAFVPDDVYGSVICGGFTVILGVYFNSRIEHNLVGLRVLTQMFFQTLERLDTLRTDMYTALDKIPTTLGRLHELLDVHYQSPKLKHYGDGVLVAVFVLLELIIRELSGSAAIVVEKIWKAPIRGSRYGHTVDEAIKSLEEAVQEFETEARICDSHRLGQVDTVTRRTLLATARIETETKKTEQGVSQLTNGFQNLADRQEHFALQFRADQAADSQKILASNEELRDQIKRSQIDHQRHGAEVHQYFYCFLTSSPLIDSKTGALDQYQAQRRLIRELTPVSSFEDDAKNPDPKPFSETAKSLVDSWNKVAGDAKQVAENDLRHSIGEITAKENDTAEHIRTEHARVGYILTSSELMAWLLAGESSLLMIQSNSESGEEYTVSSYSSALLVGVIQKINKFPVLYHFSATRTAAPGNRMLKGVAGLYISLITQLLDHLQSQGVDVELDFLERVIRYLRKGDRKPRQLRRTFEELIARLPLRSGLFIIVDALWKLQDSEGKEEVENLLKLVKREERQIKLFVTDALSLRIIDPLTAWMKKTQRRAEKTDIAPPKDRVCVLEVPDDVEAYHTEFNVAWIKEELQGSVEKSNSSRSGSSVESSGD